MTSSDDIRAILARLNALERDVRDLWIQEAYGDHVDIPGRLRLMDAGELTIAAGVITVAGSYHRVDTEGDAASDDLDTITGGQLGMLLVLRAENDARTVVCKNGIGNLVLGPGDFSLDSIEDRLLLQYDGTNWLEMARADNS